MWLDLSLVWELFPVFYMFCKLLQILFETAADWFTVRQEMVWEALWNVRFPGVIVFVGKHFLISLQDLSLDILHLPASSALFS